MSISPIVKLEFYLFTEESGELCPWYQEYGSIDLRYNANTLKAVSSIRLVIPSQAIYKFCCPSNLHYRVCHRLPIASVLSSWKRLALISNFRVPYFCYYKTHLYLLFSVFAETYNQNLEDFYLINKYFRGVFYSRASSIQKRLIIAKIRYS